MFKDDLSEIETLQSHTFGHGFKHELGDSLVKTRKKALKYCSHNGDCACVFHDPIISAWFPETELNCTFLFPKGQMLQKFMTRSWNAPPASV